MGRRSRGTGCLGCITVIALLVACFVVLGLRLAPPVVRSILEAQRKRFLDAVGLQADEPSYDASQLGYAGSQLSESQQLVYLKLYDGITQLVEDFSVLDATNDDVDVAYRALMRDHPEFFWLDGSCVYTYAKVSHVVVVKPGLSLPLDQVPQIKSRIEAAADDFLQSLPEECDDYTVLQSAYEFIISTTDYQIDAEQSQNIQSVLLNHASVCAGYSRAYQYLLQRAGLFCAYVEGSITSTGEDHAWNLVRIGDTYAYVDCTWGDPTYRNDEGMQTNGIIYDYLGVTTDELLRDQHVFSTDETWPSCESNELDYYYRYGRLLDSYDEEVLSSQFWEQSATSESTAAWKFTNDDAFQAAADALDAGTFLRSDLLAIAESRGDSQLRYGYTVNDALRIVKIYW
ncbi:MAG: hypothetical protein IKG22_11845 [Atopobiaceae bacterium]|nr:hypothetical protein [Atopobiaceae bacterium]